MKSNAGKIANRNRVRAGEEVITPKSFKRPQCTNDLMPAGGAAITNTLSHVQIPVTGPHCQLEEAMSKVGARWVLAFDASCGTCRTVSHAIGQACNGKLEVLPLDHPEVRSWRQEILGSEAPWAPTLMRLRGTDVHAWTGAGMGLQLTRSLGPRSTLRVLRSLGRLHRQRNVPPSDEPTAGSIMDRGRFLQLGAGLALATGMLLTGRIPALADEACAAARSWVDANRGRLPESYDEIVARPMVYRRAILEALPPRVQSRLWVEHVERYRASHPGLTAEQTAVADRVAEMAAAESTFQPAAAGPELRQRLKTLEDAAVQALGRDQASALVATFGPPERATVAYPLMPGAVGCTCSVDSDYCTNSTVCRSRSGDCRVSTTGCGTLYQRPCDGRCFN
jgi:hypothetical protein